MALTPKQSRFVDEYLIDLNATQAAIRAGYSTKTAEQSGAQLFRNIKIRAVIDAGLAKKQARNEITADYVIGELHDIAKKAKGAFSDDPTNSSMANSALKGFELLGKYLGIFVDRHEINATVKTEQSPMTTLFDDE